MSMIGIGALLDTAWDRYRAGFKPLIIVSAWLGAVLAINIVAILLYPQGESVGPITIWEQIGFVLFYMNNIVVAAIVGTLLINALTDTVHRLAEKQTVSFKVVWARAWKLFLPQLWVRLLLLVVYVATSAIPFGLFWLATNKLAGVLPAGPLFALLFLSLLFVAIPAVAAIFLSFTGFALVVDNKRGWQALAHSVALVRERFWPVCLRLLIPKLLYFGVFFLVQYILVVVITVLGFSLIPSAESVLGVRFTWIALVASYGGLFILLNPILNVTDYLIYSNLKQRV